MQFGLFLVKQGAITPSQFIEALECQLASRPQVGALAIELGKLTVKDVFKVLRTQADEPKELFGDLALKAGILTEDDLSSLLYHQSVRVRPMESIVTDLGFATVEVIENSLAKYRAVTHAPEELQPASAT